ncbi:hypothetical protein HYC85_013249 [Camellia sinensis]|uniref:Chromo domain-containing protein n=1 Tax=Camellia sinensis TaxID=4442 RepID=A0A7J7H2U5_CAMSI|nr:hypothetical protein HYC85_013249 [Camellia sinensis]
MSITTTITVTGSNSRLYYYNHIKWQNRQQQQHCFRVIHSSSDSKPGRGFGRQSTNNDYKANKETTSRGEQDLAPFTSMPSSSAAPSIAPLDPDLLYVTWTQMKDLGHFRYFLGIEVASSAMGYLLSQTKKSSTKLPGTTNRAPGLSFRTDGKSSNIAMDLQFEERVEAVKRSALEQKKIDESKEYRAIDYDAPVESDPSTIGLSTKIGIGGAIVVFGLVFALGDFLPTGSDSPIEEATIVNSKRSEEERTNLQSLSQRSNLLEIKIFGILNLPKNGGFIGLGGLEYACTSLSIRMTYSKIFGTPHKKVIWLTSKILCRIRLIQLIINNIIFVHTSYDHFNLVIAVCVVSFMANSSNNIEHALWQTRLQQYEATLAASPEDPAALEVSCCTVQEINGVLLLVERSRTMKTVPNKKEKWRTVGVTLVFFKPLESIFRLLYHCFGGVKIRSRLVRIVRSRLEPRNLALGVDTTLLGPTPASFSFSLLLFCLLVLTPPLLGGDTAWPECQLDKEVERILDHKTEEMSKKNRRTHYLVKWKGLPESDTSWEKDVKLWQFEKQVVVYLNTLPMRTSASFGGVGFKSLFLSLNSCASVLTLYQSEALILFFYLLLFCFFLLLATAVTLAELGEYTRAGSLLEDLTKKKPNDPDAFRLLGEVKYELRDYDGSAAAYRRSAMVSKTINFEVLRGLTNALLAAKKPDEALQVLLASRERLNIEKSNDASMNADRSSLETDSQAMDPIQVELLLGKVYSDWGHISDALSVYDQLISTHPDDFRGYLAKSSSKYEYNNKHERNHHQHMSNNSLLISSNFFKILFLLNKFKIEMREEKNKRENSY